MKKQNLLSLIIKIYHWLLRREWLYQSLSFLTPYSSKLSSKKAREILNDFSPKPMSETIVLKPSNVLTKPFPYDLQIVVPCYNVEQYIIDCIESVLSQNTKYSIRLILINDGSTDNTLSLLERYRDDARVMIINQPNGGMSSARNAGLINIVGKYVMFLDSDDFLYPGAIDALMNEAYQYDVDIVQGSYETVYPDGKHDLSHQYHGEIESNKLTGFPWGKVYRSSLLENFQFPVGYWFEDSMNHFQLHTDEKKVVAVKDPVYGYRRNNNSITANLSKKKKVVDTYWVLEPIMATLSKNGVPFDEKLAKKMETQFLLNYSRTCEMPLRIKKSIFILQYELFEKYFLYSQDNKDQLKEILHKRQYGRYVLWANHMA